MFGWHFMLNVAHASRRKNRVYPRQFLDRSIVLRRYGSTFSAAPVLYCSAALTLGHSTGALLLLRCPVVLLVRCSATLPGVYPTTLVLRKLRWSRRCRTVERTCAARPLPQRVSMTPDSCIRPCSGTSSPENRMSESPLPRGLFCPHFCEDDVRCCTGSRRRECQRQQ